MRFISPFKKTKAPFSAAPKTPLKPLSGVFVERTCPRYTFLTPNQQKASFSPRMYSNSNNPSILKPQRLELITPSSKMTRPLTLTKSLPIVSPQHISRRFTSKSPEKIDFFHNPFDPRSLQCLSNLRSLSIGYNLLFFEDFQRRAVEIDFLKDLKRKGQSFYLRSHPMASDSKTVNVLSQWISTGVFTTPQKFSIKGYPESKLNSVKEDPSEAVQFLHQNPWAIRFPLIVTPKIAFLVNSKLSKEDLTNYLIDFAH